MVGAFSSLGLTFICFQTNKRKHMYGKPVPSSRGGSCFSIPVPTEQKLLGLRGQIGKRAAGSGEEVGSAGRGSAGGPLSRAAIQSLSPVFARQYLDDAQVSAVTMGKGEDKVREKSRRKINRVSGSRSANSSLVGSVGSQQSQSDKQVGVGVGAPKAAKPEASSQHPGKKSSEKSADYVKVVRTWRHPIGNEIEGEFEGDRLNGRATFTWQSGDRYACWNSPVNPVNEPCDTPKRLVNRCIPQVRRPGARRHCAWLGRLHLQVRRHLQRRLRGRQYARLVRRRVKIGMNTLRNGY